MTVVVFDVVKEPLSWIEKKRLTTTQYVRTKKLMIVAKPPAEVSK